MIKDILVNLNVGAEANWASDYAISVAAALNAHLTGIVFLYGPIMPVSRAGYVPPELEVIERRNEAAVEAARESFTAASIRAGVKAEPLTLSAKLGQRRRPVRPDRAALRSNRCRAGGAGNQCGRGEHYRSRAVRFRRTAYRRPVHPERAAQAGPRHRLLGRWPVTRATRDAIPFLRRAGRIEVVIVSNEPGKQDQVERVDIGAHLARHGLNVAVKRMPLGDVDVAAMLLSHAADEGADFIVMGGYGHSRLREFVLGGVTRSMLRTMTVPVLMSH